MVLNKKDICIWVNSIILIIYQTLLLTFFIVARPYKPLITVAMVLVSFLSILQSNVKSTKLSIDPKTIINILITFLFVVFIQLLNDTFTISTVFLLAAPAFAYFIINSNFKIRILSVFYYAVMLYLFLKVRSATGMELNEVFVNASRNTFSILSISFTIIYYFILLLGNRKINLLPSFLSLIISFMAVGRSGMISSFLLFVALAILILNSHAKWLKVLIVSGSFLCCLLLVTSSSFLLSVDDIEQLDHLLNDGVEDGSRESIFQEYVEGLNVYNMIVGYNYTNLPVMIHFEMNPHNSYIRFHHLAGIVALYYLFLIIKSAHFLYKKSKINFIFLCVLLLRGLTDSVFFFSGFDFLIFLFLIMYKKQLMYEKSY